MVTFTIKNSILISNQFTIWELTSKIKCKETALWLVIVGDDRELFFSIATHCKQINSVDSARGQTES